MKLKKGDKVYFTKESAPDFNTNYLTYGKEYKIISCDEDFFKIIADNNYDVFSTVNSSGHLNSGNWLKVKTKKRKLEKEIEELNKKLESTKVSLKASIDRIYEIEKINKLEKLELVNSILQKLGVVIWSINSEADKLENANKHTFELTINN